MCLSPCTEAIAFSILRATSVSSCAGASRGSDAVTVTVGRSMSGKFCTFMPLKARTPPKVSSTNTITAGMGLRIDQEETLSTGVLLLRVGCGRWSGRRFVGDSHEVAVVEETSTVGDDHGIGRQAAHHLDAIAREAPRLDLHLRDAVVAAHAEDVAEPFAHHHGRLGNRHGIDAAEI